MRLHMRSIVVLIFTALFACGGSSPTTIIPGADASTNPDGSGTDGAIAVDSSGMGNCSPACAMGQTCDPIDNKCKPDGTGSHIGDPCSTSGADPKCGSDPKAICNDQTQDGFPGGYCAYEPCSTVQLCPIGASCAHLGGEANSCWKNCTTNADCQNRVNGTDYECLAIDPLFTSGTSHKVCFLKAFACVMPADCPAGKPMCNVLDAGAGLCK